MPCFKSSDIIALDEAYRDPRYWTSSNSGIGHSPPPVQVKNDSPDSGHPAPLELGTHQ